MNKNAEKWVAALRSGEYSQGQGYLRTDNNYCCLGVACDVYQKETGKGEWKEANPGAWAFVIDKQVARMALPDPVMKWLGMVTESGEFAEDDGSHTTLADANDAGVPFQQIAKIIEETSPELFNA